MIHHRNYSLPQHRQIFGIQSPDEMQNLIFQIPGQNALPSLFLWTLALALRCSTYSSLTQIRPNFSWRRCCTVPAEADLRRYILPANL